MPVRLLVFLGAIMAAFLYITFFNTNPAEIRLYQDLKLSLPISVIMLVSFAAGSVTVMLLYFYDAFVDVFAQLKKNSAEKRARRVAQLYESGVERLLI